MTYIDNALGEIDNKVGKYHSIIQTKPNEQIHGYFNKKYTMGTNASTKN